MITTSLSDLKAHLSEYAERAEREHERYTITRNGRPAVVMVGAGEWEEVQETLFWLSQPDWRERLAEAAADAAEGRVHGEPDARALLARLRGQQ
ncbi:type II toxin-antitoxin system Phd/YefM family antitoxin [Sinomonas cellulolyticus]|uniref:Antitoxin n=1 Tax=Sinomonas cellulolyticus TaxID=2801916 RepID=A0ABS1JXS5_9MICC|nr:MULTISPECIES: type II toxin-antitoxin system Phd/YefM family antitoxin [Sinomonas]MBL0704005.1 type II toxin-antitoxin system Phd/YefM family antitoxin [Sinomonas cellulolyticus]